MPISFQTQAIKYSLASKLLVRRWINEVISAEKKIPGTLNFLFTSDEELLRMNNLYLAHNTYTDIITFDSGANGRVEGDIVISVDRVRDNAKKFNQEFGEEMHRVIIHGVLHLCGYKDKTMVQKKEMRKKENAALKRLSKMA